MNFLLVAKEGNCQHLFQHLRAEAGVWFPDPTTDEGRASGVQRTLQDKLRPC